MFVQNLESKLMKDANQISFLVENNSCLLVDGEAADIAKLLESHGYGKNYLIGFISESLDTDLSSSPIRPISSNDLIVEMLRDPLLSQYSCLVIEINMMEIYLSILLSLCKKIIKKRKEFRIVLIYKNANQIDEIIEFYKPAVQTMQINSKRFQVQEFFLESSSSDYIREAVETVLKINDEEGPGDILLLVPSQEDVDTIISLVNDRSVESRIAINCLPIYEILAKDQLLFAQQPAQSKSRKLIVSTSRGQYVNIDGIVYVVDSGLESLQVFDPKTNIEEQVTSPISKNTALYRLELAGKSRPGRCFRLYTKHDKDNNLLERDVLEIERSSLARPILMLKSLGVENLVNFDFITPPSASIVKSDLETLFKHGAISSEGALTRQGQFMAEVPFQDLNIAAFLFNSAKFSCSEEVVAIISMLQVHYFVPSTVTKSDEIKRKYSVQEGDFITLFNIYQAFIQSRKSPSWCSANLINFKAMQKVLQIRNSLVKLLKNWHLPLTSCGSDIEALQKCIAASFWRNLAQRQPDASYKMLNGKKGYLHPSSVVFKSVPKWIVFEKIEETSKVWFREASVVEPLWLPELVPLAFKIK